MILFFLLSLLQDKSFSSNEMGLTASGIQCFKQLSEEFHEFCPVLTLDLRIDLAVKMTKCQMAYDHRDQNLPITENSTEFVSQLKEPEFKSFTMIFLQVESTCLKLSQQTQIKTNTQKIIDLGSAVSLSADYILALQKVFQMFSSNVTYLFETIEDKVFEDLAQTRDLLNLLESIGKTIQQTLFSINYVLNSIKLLSAYCIVLLTSFFLSLFLLPDLFFTMTSITFVFIFAQNKIPINIQSFLITEKSYYSIWIILIIIMLILRFKPKTKKQSQKKTYYPRLYSISK